MKVPGLLTAWLLALAATAGAQTSPQIQDDWPDFRYVEPRQVRELPGSVRTDLERRGCMIPRFIKWDAHHNAIQGQFYQAGQRDWAVLCRLEGKTAILIYPGAGATNVEELRSQTSDPYRIIHTVSAFVLGKRAIRDKQTDSLPAYDHDGIEDGRIQDKATVLYRHEGTWREY